MTRAQAYDMLDAMATRNLAGALVLAFDAQARPTYSVSFSTTSSYDGTALAAIAAYCEQHGLALSIKIAEMGVV